MTTNYNFGFELEGFAYRAEGISTDEDNVCIPPSHWPTDGFPGLVEARTRGGNSLEGAITELVREVTRIQCSSDEFYFDIYTHEHTFSAEMKNKLRAERDFSKGRLFVRNVYGKKIKDVGKKTQASFQINISNLVAPARTEEVRTNDTTKLISYPARYGVLDVNEIVREFDKEFKEEISEANRQPGLYAIKDDYRLEYRSLPNFVFKSNIFDNCELIKRIRKCL